MQRLLIFLLSLTVLTSSCATKKALWEQFGIKSAAPTKPLSAKSLASFCAGTDDSFDVIEKISGTAATAPALVAVLFVVAFTFPRQSSHSGPDYFRQSFSITEKVPLYLKLGRLIYYS